MVKKNSGKVIQMLSPANYIRTKARSLPLFECLINNDWEDGKQATCIISRKHSNGNITFCSYFVDLLCFGVKHTSFAFNESLSEFREFLAQTEEEVKFELVDYDLVHNVIYAGVVFAEEYEFKPAKDFTSLTEYFLEEDNDDIELIEIECGDDSGRPVYVYSSVSTTPREREQIVAHLERTAGPDNYSLLDEDDLSEEDDYFDDLEDLDDEDSFYLHQSFEENKEIFISLYLGFENSKDPNDLDRLINVTDALFLEITDNDLVDQYYDELFDRLGIQVEADEISNELLGLSPETVKNEAANELFMSVFLNIHKNLKKANSALELLRKEAGPIPGVAFLELLMIQKENSNKYAGTLQKYAQEYPDYPLIMLLRSINIFATEDVPNEIVNKSFNLDLIFPGRKSIHFLEMFYFLMFVSYVIEHDGNVDMMEAFYQVLDEFDLPEEIVQIVEESFSFSRFTYLANYFNIKNKS